VPADPSTPVLSDEVFRLIFDASPVGVGLADENGHFLAVNPSLCRLFGRPAEEVIGHDSVAYTHPDDRPFHDRAGALVEASDDGIARVEKRYVRPNGEIRWAWLTFRHTPGPEGQIWTLAHVQDVTERFAAEQALRESESNLRAVADVLRGVRSGSDVRPNIVRGAATMTNAELFNLSEEIGVIKPGYKADLLVIEGNPLEDLNLLQEQGRFMSIIMQGGKFAKNELAA